MIKVDFHVHSIGSPDSVSKPEDLVSRAKKVGLGKLIITDHNNTASAVEIQKRYPDFVIVGEEILTTSGEILALFVKEQLPKGIEPEEAFRRLRDQGAFISLSHPYAHRRHGWSEEEMERYLPYLDAIEISNARNRAWMNDAAKSFAAAHGLGGTAGSDAHGVPELGTMGLSLPEFNTADELRAVIKQGTVFGHEHSDIVRIYSRGSAFLKWVNRKTGLKLY